MRELWLQLDHGVEIAGNFPEKEIWNLIFNSLGKSSSYKASLREKQFPVQLPLGGVPGLRIFGGCLESGLENLMIKQCF